MPTLEEGLEATEDKKGESVEEFNSNFKEFWSKQNEAKQRAREMSEAARLQRERERLEMASATMDDLFTEAGRVAQRRMQKKGDDESEEEEEVEEEDEEEDMSMALKTDADHKARQKEAEAKEAKSKKKKKEDAVLDPDKFVQTVDLTKKKRLPDLSAGGDGDEDEEDGAEDFDAQAAAISEAFAGDDVTTDFVSEKQAEVEKGRPKDVDLTLPGWGSWGGEGLKVRFVQCYGGIDKHFKITV